MLMNTAVIAGLVTGYTRFALAPTGGILLCTGEMPTDEEVDAMTSVTAAQIVDNKAATFAAIPLADMKAKDTAIPCLVYAEMSAKKVNAIKTGTIGWGVLISERGFTIVDVGLINSGAVLQLSSLDAVSGSPVTLLSVSYSLGR